LPITRSTREKNKRKKKKRTKLHKWEKTYPKNSFPLCFEKSGVFIAKGALGSITGPPVETRHVAPLKGHGNAIFATFSLPFLGHARHASECKLLACPPIGSPTDF